MTAKRTRTKNDTLLVSLKNPQEDRKAENENAENADGQTKHTAVTKPTPS